MLLASVAPPPAPGFCKSPVEAELCKEPGQHWEGEINKTLGPEDGRPGTWMEKDAESSWHSVLRSPVTACQPLGCCPRCLSSSLIHKVEPGAGDSALLLVFLPDGVTLFTTNVIS